MASEAKVVLRFESDESVLGALRKVMAGEAFDLSVDQSDPRIEDVADFDDRPARAERHLDSIGMAFLLMESGRGEVERGLQNVGAPAARSRMTGETGGGGRIEIEVVTVRVVQDRRGRAMSVGDPGEVLARNVASSAFLPARDAEAGFARPDDLRIVEGMALGAGAAG